jgi:hypothetical protein
MTRRDFVWTAAAATAALATEAPLIVPVRRVIDTRAKCTPEQLDRFSSSIWPEAVRDFSRCGIQLQGSEGRGEIRRSPGDRPIFVGLERGVLNVVLTYHIPMRWDHGRGLAGVTTLHEGHHLCVIALEYAHGHQIPFLSVNTCVHELLHAMLQDIFLSRPKWYQADEREFRIDWYATRMWLFHDGAAIRKPAQAYVDRLRSGRFELF